MVRLKCQSLCLFFCMFLLSELYASAAPPFRHDHSIDFSNHGITISPVTKESLPTLKRLGYSDGLFQQMADWLPSCFLIQNGSAKSIRAITIRYEKISIPESGRVILEVHQTQTAPRGALKGGIEPSGFAIVTPSERMTRTLESRNPSAAFLSADFGSLQMSFSSSLYSEVVVKLDSLVMSDGQVIGPDVTDVVQQEADTYKGKMDVFREFIAKGNLSKEELKVWLLAVSKDTGRMDQRRRPDFYKASTSSTALGLLVLSDKSSLDELRTVITASLSHSPPVDLPHK